MLQTASLPSVFVYASANLTQFTTSPPKIGFGLTFLKINENQSSPMKSTTSFTTVMTETISNSIGFLTTAPDQVFGDHPQSIAVELHQGQVIGPQIARFAAPKLRHTWKKRSFSHHQTLLAMFFSVFFILDFWLGKKISRTPAKGLLKNDEIDRWQTLWTMIYRNWTSNWINVDFLPAPRAVAFSSGCGKQTRQSLRRFRSQYLISH